MPVRRSTASARPAVTPNPAAPAPAAPMRENLCTFTFSDARQCRNHLQSTHPYLCTFHAAKDDQALASEQFGKDIAYFLSARYLSACDLTTALGHLFAAVAQGKIKPKTAATLAYLAQTMVRTIEISESEYTNAFGTDDWRKIIRSSVTANSKYLDPDIPSTSTPAASPAQNAPSTQTEPPSPRSTTN